DVHHRVLLSPRRDIAARDSTPYLISDDYESVAIPTRTPNERYPIAVLLEHLLANRGVGYPHAVNVGRARVVAVACHAGASHEKSKEGSSYFHIALEEFVSK